MSMNVHFLHSVLEFFPPNLGAASDDESGERIRQNIPTMEKRYAGKSSQNMLADCSNLIENVAIASCNLMSYRKKF
jgi:hypothetical protein